MNMNGANSHDIQSLLSSSARDFLIRSNGDQVRSFALGRFYCGSILNLLGNFLLLFVGLVGTSAEFS